MKLIVSEEEFALLRSYGVRNFNDLRLAAIRTGDERLYSILAKSIAVTSGLNT